MAKHYLDIEGLEDYTGKLTTKYKTIFASKTDVGTPLVAATAAAMTDTTKIYVYTGSETGYTAGNWYYYNGSAWVSGGIYNSIAVETDTTLSESGMAADAKATGDAIEEIDTDITDLKNAIDIISLPWKSGALYQATGIEYAIASRSVTPFLPVTPCETIYIERDSSLSGVGVFEFTSNTTTASGVNERLSFYSISANKSFYTVGESTHYVRLQCNYPLADVVGKVTVLRLSSSLNAVIERFSPSFVTPSMFADQTNNTDAKMIQAAVNYAFSHKCDVGFDRMYTLNSGEYILLNKYSGHVETSNRFLTRFFGVSGGGIIYKYSGNIFTANNAYASESGDFSFENLTFESETGAGCNVFNMNTMMRFTVKGCFFKNVDSVAKNTYIESSARTHYWQDATFEDCTIIGGKGWAFFADGVYVVELNNLTIEHRDGGVRFGVYHGNESYPYARCRGLKITNCCIEGISGANVRTLDGNNNPANAWAIHVECPSQVLIQGCYFEGNYKNILMRNGGSDEVYSADICNCWLSGYFNKERYGSESSYKEIVNDKYIVTIGGTLGNYKIENCSTERGGVINAPASASNMTILYLANSLNPAAKGERDFSSYSYDSATGTWSGSGAVYNDTVVTGGNNNQSVCKTYQVVSMT